MEVYTDTVVGEIDVASAADRRTLCRAVRLSWITLTEERKARYLQALDVALSMSLSAKDRREIVNCVRMLTVMEAQNQADRHLNHKNDRLDDGLDVDQPRTVILRVAPPRLLDTKPA